jgi:hypothetical protein
VLKNSCGCDYPVLGRIVDALVSKRPKKNGLSTVDRYLDCLYHGPQVVRIEVFLHGPTDEFTRPFVGRRVGEPKGKTIHIPW